MSPYTLLTAENVETLRRERVLALEADHQRLDLLLREEDKPAERVRMGEELADLERRIAVHTVPEVIGAPSETVIDDPARSELEPETEDEAIRRGLLPPTIASSERTQV